MALIFPSSPTDGQIYTDSATGYRYVYKASYGVWTVAANNVGMSVSSTPPGNVAPGALWYNREIGRTFLYYDDGDSKQWVETVPATGFFDSSTVASYANVAAQIYYTPVYNTTNAAFSKANAALPNVSNAVFDGNLRVTGVLSIGSNTITITDKHIVANDYYRMNTSGHIVAVVDGNKVNVIYTVANAAFDSANNVGPQIAPSYNTANAAFATANAAFAFTWDTTAKTSDFTALANTGYFVNTTSNQVVVNLPSTPAPGAKVTIVDYAGTAATYNIVLNVGSNKMNSYQSNGAINTNRASLDLIYVDSTQGWVNYSSYIQTTSYQTYAIEYLIVAGGGGGGYNAGAGGGAGGMLSGSTTVTIGTGYSMVVGGGGSYNTGNGSNSTGLGLTAIGGGGGASNDSSGNSGGSGGGGATNSGGSGTSGQGNNGGNGDGQTGASRSGAGGGGKGAAGQNTPSSSQGGAGGAGAEWPSGSGTYYAGGGGGSPHGGSGGAGGTGGGGAGSSGGTSNGSDGTTNKGGGGGAGGGYGNNGKNGGSGIVIIRYLGSQRATGGTVTSSGGYTYHTFTSSGTFTA